MNMKILRLMAPLLIGAYIEWLFVLFKTLRNMKKSCTVMGQYYTADGCHPTVTPPQSSSNSTDDSMKVMSPSALGPKRLEFVHITKTGGSAIESAGHKHGIIWGACHYMSIPDVGCSQPDIEYIAPDFQSYKLTSPWHTPPKILASFSNVGNESSSKQNPYHDADLFTVIRNPYSRIVSEYYCPWQGFKPKFEKGTNVQIQDVNDPVHLNWWVKDTINRLTAAMKEFDEQNRSTNGDMKWRVQKKGLNEDAKILAQKHMINQAEYIFDDNGNTLIKNIVHYENLSQEFGELMQSYGLHKVSLPQKESGGVYTDTSNLKKRLTFRDLNEKSIQLINDFARSDFEKLGYVMVEDGFSDDYSLEAKVQGVKSS